MRGTRPSFAGEPSTAGPLQATVTALLDLLFPWSCAACGSPRGGALCQACRDGLSWLPPAAICPRCGLPPGPDTCGPCRLDPPAFARARAVAAYGVRGGEPDPLGEMIRAFKYGRRRALAVPLGELLARHQPFAPGEHDRVVPVPLHPDRLRERGFNQAALLARPVATRLGLEIVVDALRRVRPTPPQVSLDEEERRRNVRAAFVVRRPEAIRKRHILLVDDVITSGATADACARALRAGGAARVDVLSVGRALRPGSR